MPWFKVDDSFHSHPKTLAASPGALGLWVVAGSWAAANPDDGFVPAHVLRRLLPDSESLADELVSLRLWVKARGGYKFHDWNDVQPSREEVTKVRRAARERQANRRRRLAGIGATETPETESPQVDTQPVTRDTGVTHTVTSQGRHSTPTRPDPTRPLEVAEATSRPRSRGSRLPEDWTLPDTDRQWALREKPGLDVDLEAAKFRDYWVGRSGKDATKLDWTATWRNWVRNARPSQRPPGQRRDDSGRLMIGEGW